MPSTLVSMTAVLERTVSTIEGKNDEALCRVELHWLETCDVEQSTMTRIRPPPARSYRVPVPVSIQLGRGKF